MNWWTPVWSILNKCLCQYYLINCLSLVSFSCFGSMRCSSSSITTFKLFVFTSYVFFTFSNLRSFFNSPFFFLTSIDTTLFKKFALWNSTFPRLFIFSSIHQCSVLNSSQFHHFCYNPVTALPQSCHNPVTILSQSYLEFVCFCDVLCFNAPVSIG